jgi:single-strand DNA-binding protein
MNAIEAAFFGRVASVADLKTSAAGKAWLAIKVAVGHGEDNTQWVRAVCFGAVAEQLASALQKGDRVYIEGDLRLDRWKNDAGEDRSGLSVAAWKVEKVGASAIGRNRPAKPKAPPEGENPAPAASNGDRRHWQRRADDDIPFAPESR